MNLKTLLFAHHGRVSRRAYWIYTAIAVAILAFGIWLVNPSYGEHWAYLNGPQLAMSLAFALIGLGVSVKRVNDFGGPRWQGWFVPVLSMTYDISDYLRLFGDVSVMGPRALLFYAIGMTILAGVIYVGVRRPIP